MRSTHKRVLLAMAALFMLSTLLVGCGRGSVAKVDGRRITKQEYYNRLERLPFRDPATGQEMEAGALVVQRLIDEVLVLRLAETEKVAPKEEEVKERVAQAQKRPNFAQVLKQSGVTKEQFKEMMRVEQALFNLQTKGVKVEDKEVQEYYDKNKDTLFTTPEQAEVAAIFTSDKASTDKVSKMLKDGVDFGAVAKAHSTERNSAENLGILPRPLIKGDRNIPDSVQKIVFGTAKGKYTQPISDEQGGYVIFKVLNHRKATTQKFKDVEYMIRQQLMIEKGMEKQIDVQDMLAKFREKADISVGIERYKKQLEPEKAKDDKKSGDEDKSAETSDKE